ncbi:16S rRNA (uracil(1498)-N(3))-methyltransferase [Bacteroidota bacterium]
MNIFYKPHINADHIVLDPKESAHCIKVLRSKKGDRVYLIDGRGGYYEAEIVEDDPRACRISIVSSQFDYQPLNYELHLAVAPTKSMDRFEWFIEKATEIGITSITPIQCSRSERKNIRKDRIEKVMIAAAKQSVKAYFPDIQELTPFADWVKQHRGKAGYIAHCMDGQKTDIRQIPVHESLYIAIGPEGDFTPEELKLAQGCGFESMSLGAFRLRTETAAVFVCSALSYKLQV